MQKGITRKNKKPEVTNRTNSKRIELNPKYVNNCIKY